jgi:uncharacterized protein
VATFLDTVYLLALINPNDEWRPKALEWAAHVSGALVTTEAVLTEVADALCRSAHRRWAVDAIRDLRSDSAVTCVPGSARLFAHGLDLYADRADKNWSLTDCVSFVVMRERGIRQALTADVHFVQAGFRALLRE